MTLLGAMMNLGLIVAGLFVNALYVMILLKIRTILCKTGVLRLNEGNSPTMGQVQSLMMITGRDSRYASSRSLACKFRHRL